MKIDMQWTTRKEIINVFIGSLIVWLFFSFYFAFFVALETPVVWSLLPPIWAVLFDPKLAAFQCSLPLLVELTEKTIIHSLPTQWPSLLNVLKLLCFGLTFASVYTVLCLLILRSKRSYQKKRGFSEVLQISWWKVPCSFLILSLWLWVIHVATMALLMVIHRYVPVQYYASMDWLGSEQIYLDWLFAGILYLLGFLKFL